MRPSSSTSEGLFDAVLSRGAVAAEVNVSKTAFVDVSTLADTGEVGLRWFTPTVEVEICGHATLASAHVLWNERGYAKPEITFLSQSGLLRVRREEDGRLVLDFPSRPPQLLAIEQHPQVLLKSLGPGAATPLAVKL